jgi:hypothetical protein
MSRCNFCQREFENSQGAKAHLRTCAEYKKKKNNKVTLGTAREATASSTPTQTTAPANLFADLTNQIIRQFAGPDEATRLKQRRDDLLVMLCSNLVDRYHPQEGVLTLDMAVAAKVAILDDLGALAIQDMPEAELTLRATAIRNRVLAPYFRVQKEELAHQKQLQQQETRHIQEEAATEERRARRKARFVELGVGRALYAAKARNLTHQALVMLEWEVAERLTMLLVGDETEHDVEQVIEAAIDGPLLEWETRLEQARVAKRARRMDDCLTAALPVVQAALPWMKAAVVKKVCDTFGMPPSSPAPTDASVAAEAEEGRSDTATSHASASAHMDLSETSSPGEADTSPPPEYRRAKG